MRKIFLVFLVGVSFMVLDSCSDDSFPVPPASTVSKFSVSIDNDGFAPATATFTDMSIIPDRAGEVSYSWNFGDGTFSSEQNPVHFYAEAGSYMVTLVLITTASLEVVESSQTIVIKDADATGIPMFFNDGSSVFTTLINEDAPVVSPIGITTLGDSYGMAIDTVNDKLYMTDYDADKILVANLDGSDLQDFRTGAGGPDGIAIDYEDEMIYWDTDDGIRRADMNDTNVSQFEDFATGQDDPEGVSIDPVTRVVFWNNYNDGGVWKKNIDGTGEAKIISTGGGGSTIVIGNRLFYDDYIASGDIHLKSADFDGGNIATVATGITRVVFGLAYDEINTKIFWGDRNVDTIMRANLDGSEAEPWHVGTNSPRGIVIGRE